MNPIEGSRMDKFKVRLNVIKLIGLLRKFILYIPEAFVVYNCIIVNYTNPYPL